MKIKITLLIIFSTLITLGQKFIEVSETRGLNYHYPGHHRQEVGAGITVIDINNDGWDDLFQSGGSFESKIWINHNGTFMDETNSYLPDSIKHRHIQSAIAGDYNNDGFEDLILTNMSFFDGDKKSPVLLKNIEGKKFIQVFENTFNQIGHFPGAAWGDINNDGFIDLYILNYVQHMYQQYDDSMNYHIGYIPICLPNLFFTNNSGTAFEEISKLLQVNDSGCGLACMFTDFDHDADMDLILLNDFAQWNHLGNRVYRNEYPELKFTDISKESGLYAEFYGMGIGAGDYDYDGDLDYYFTNIGPNSLIKNSDGKFINVANQLGIDLGYDGKKKSTSWTGLFFDVENDGDLDLFVTKGYLESLEKATIKEYNRLMIYKKNRFIDKSEPAKINDSIPNRGAALVDFNHDGYLDIVTNSLELGRSEFANMDQKIKLYQNISKHKNNWIGIKLVGSEGMNSSAIGCSAKFEIKGKWYIKEVDGGSGHSSQSSKTLYFGLGKQKTISNIEVKWIGGGTIIIPELKANKCYQITPDGTIVVLY